MTDHMAVVRGFGPWADVSVPGGLDLRTAWMWSAVQDGGGRIWWLRGRNDGLHGCGP
jgi:hypothetical protein